MNKKNCPSRTSAILFLISSGLFLASGILNMLSSDKAFGTTYLCLCFVYFCLAVSSYSKYKKESNPIDEKIIIENNQEEKENE